MSIPLDELASPADADMFRMTVDYGRWYIDTLPGCDIAPATEDRWPSCTTVKKASEKDWSFLVINRIAALPAAEIHRLTELDPTQRADALKSHENLSMRTAFGRGAIVHLWAEDLGAGRQPREITDQWLAANRYPQTARTEALRYRAAMVDFFQTYQPEPIAAEYVTIHRDLNGHGYGATPDGLFRIEGETVAVDWKTRSDGSNHAAYAEELAQVACGARAQYMIQRDGDGAVRRLLPDIAGGYVVSIKTDGARLYPLDIPKGWDYWCRLHEWWVRRLTEKDGIGRVKPKRSKVTIVPEGAPEPVARDGTSSPPVPDERATLKARYDALTTAQREAFKARGIAKGDLAAVAAALDELEHPPTTLERAKARMAAEPVAEQGTPEAPADEADVNTARVRYHLDMSGEQKAWTASIVQEAINAHRDIRVTVKNTQRNADLSCAITQYAVSKHWDPDSDEGFRAAIYIACGDASVFWPTLTLGDALGQLDAVQARQLRDTVDAIDQELLVGVVDEDTKTLRWSPRATPAA